MVWAVIVRVIERHALGRRARVGAHKAAGAATYDTKLSRQIVQAVAPDQPQLIVRGAAERACLILQNDILKTHRRSTSSRQSSTIRTGRSYSYRAAQERETRAARRAPARSRRP